MATAQANKGQITLKGSVEIVAEYFEYSINSILFQRGLYPPENFKKTSKYGLGIMVTTDEALRSYLSQVMGQLRDWLLNHLVQKLVLVISGVESKQILERWQFDVFCEKSLIDNPITTTKKTEKEVMAEIQAIIRQITASVTFLPLLEEPCTFELLVYTDTNTAVPLAWEVSDPRNVVNAQQVRLRSFDTSVHKVDTMVAYRTVDT